MQSHVFPIFNLPAKCTVTAERGPLEPLLAFRAPGEFRTLHLTGASQLRQQLEFAGEHSNAAAIGVLMDEARSL